ncbi:hypothetical protein [Winogradskyella wichelsiae]|nr:hypothetical protein [Winogradskyella wichelsiae]
MSDTLQNSLAVPQANDQDIKFAITENNGSYKLGFVKKQTYGLP